MNHLMSIKASWKSIDLLCFPGGSDGKSVCLQSGKPGFNSWVRKNPWRRKWQPTPVLLPGKFHGWRSLVGYSPLGCKESDMTVWLHFQEYVHHLASLIQGTWILSKLQETVEDRGDWWATVQGLQRVRHDWMTKQQQEHVQQELESDAYHFWTYSIWHAKHPH